MNLDGADRDIRSRIYSYESDVPSHMWDSIDQRLRPGRKKWFFWILIPVGLLGSIFLGLNYQQEDLPETPNQTILPALSTSEKTFSNQEIESDHEVAGQILAGSQLSKNPISQSDKSAAKEITRPKTKKILSVFSEAQLQTLPGSGQEARLGNLHTGDSLNSLAVIAEPKWQEDHSDLLPQRRASNSREAKELTYLESRTLFALRDEDPNIDICPSFSSTLQIKPFVEIALWGGLPFKNLSLRDAELKPYRDLRNSTEKTRSSIAFQVLGGLDIGDEIEVKTGLGITRIFEVFDYVDQTATRTITHIVTDTIFVNGQPQVRTDTNIVTEYGQRVKLSQNSFTLFNVPILAAYKFEVGHHRFFVQGGITWNFALRSRGDILAADEQIISIDTRDRVSNPIYKSQVGIDLIGGLGYEYNLKEKNVLRIMASFTHMLSDMTIEGYPLGQRYDHIQLGLSWKHQF
ncbi:MAG: hypothetical protein HKN76_01470 [Saprospiraceae bacterium]|nr:hypothetical protein [Saprospiraceae bacterium]